jgi:hypothetical protein
VQIKHENKWRVGCGEFNWCNCSRLWNCVILTPTAKTNYMLRLIFSTVVQRSLLLTNNLEMNTVETCVLNLNGLKVTLEI